MVAEKVWLEEKITEIKQKGALWLEPAREFVLSLNQAAKLIEGNNLSEMTTFLKNIGANHILISGERKFFMNLCLIIISMRTS